MASPKATYYSQYALSKFVLENVDANAKRIAILFDKTELKLSKYGGMIYPSLIIVDQMKYSNNNFAVFSDTEKVGINVKESQLTKMDECKQHYRYWAISIDLTSLRCYNDQKFYQTTLMHVENDELVSAIKANIVAAESEIPEFII